MAGDPADGRLTFLVRQMTANKAAFLTMMLAVMAASSLFAAVRSESHPEWAYFAQTGAMSFRLHQPDGVFREFDVNPRKPTEYLGAKGWVARRQDDDRVVVIPAEGGAHPARYEFVKGRLGEFAGTRMPERPGSVRELWPAAITEKQVRRVTDIWRGLGRMRLFYTNPNRAGALLAEFAVLFLGVALLRFRHRLVRVGALLLAAAAFVGMAATGSRGAVVAAVVGVVVLLVPLRHALVGRFRLLGIRGIGVIAGLAVLCAVVLSVASRSVGTRTLSADSASNRVRLRTHQLAPRMMVDAPAGWGWYASGLATGPGKAYTDWYQPQRNLDIMATLVSDHLTQLVRRGWPGRVGYLAGWLFLGALLALAVRRGLSPIPLSLWAVLFVGAAFNRIIEAATLWIAPVVATALILPGVKRILTWRRGATLLLGATGVALLIAGALALVGVCSEAGLRICASSHRICVKDADHPVRWVVDDGCVLGGGLAPNEIRYYYSQHPDAPGIGYVRDVLDLPNDVHRLVLAGTAGWDFLMALNDGRFPPDFNMPERILFLSPPFPPEAIPPLLLENVRVGLVIGEFAAAYFPSYAQKQDWVSVVPGCELYLPNWMDLVQTL